MTARTIMTVQPTTPAMAEVAPGMPVAMGVIEPEGGGFRSPSTLRITDSSLQGNVPRAAPLHLNNGMWGAKNGRADREGRPTSVRASLTAFSAAYDPSSSLRVIFAAHEARGRCGDFSGRSLVAAIQRLAVRAARGRRAGPLTWDALCRSKPMPTVATASPGRDSRSRTGASTTPACAGA